MTRSGEDEDVSPFHEVGDEFAARQFGSFGKLYGRQADAVKRIIEGIHRIAAASFAYPRRARTSPTHRGAHDPVGDHPDDFRRPHHAFVIDGRRGSGKTTALLTLRRHLSVMHFTPAPTTMFPAEDHAVLDSLASLGLRSPPGSRDRRVALVLPIVFTEDMEAQESTMEAVFALLEQELETQARRVTDDDARSRIAALKAQLRSEIGVSWTYSRKIGIETLSGDSLDYRDFVEKRAELNVKTYTKVVTWRRYLEECLDTLGYQTLVLLFDDSDLNPGMAEDIIRSMRMYFTHPRAVSILAVDVPTLTDTMIARSLSQSPFLQIFSDYDSSSKIERRKARLVSLEEENTVALLDKVLPRPNRFRLSTGDLKHVDYFFEGNGSTPETFVGVCKRHYDASLARNAGDPVWWLLAGPYKRLFGPDIRGIIAFRTRTEEGAEPPLLALLQNRDFSRLAQEVRMSVEVLQEFVASGDLDTPSEPLEPREKLLVDLWADARLAKDRLLEPADLPGIRQMLGQDTVFSERTGVDPSAIGVAALMRTELLPRNCLYVHQYRRLQRAMESALPKASRLARGLRGLTAGIRGATVDEAIGRLSELVAAEGQIRDDEQLVDYVRINIALLVRRSGDADFEDEIEEREETQVEEAAYVAVLLAALAISGRQPKNIMAWLRRPSWSGKDREEIHDFVKALAASFPGSERARQEALFLWACANDIAVLGDNNVTLDTRSVRSGIIDAAEATSTRSRLPGLANASLAAVASSARHGLLLAWSLVPLIDPLQAFGTDYLPGTQMPQDGWSTILKVFDGALANAASAAEDAAADWSFADMDEALRLRIVAEVQHHRDRLVRHAAGRMLAAAPEDFWERRPASRVATLLGVPEYWVSGNLGV